jgi:hypothetical protein
MTLYLWIIVALIIAKLLLLIPLILSIRESHATIKRCNTIIKGDKP